MADKPSIDLLCNEETTGLCFAEDGDDSVLADSFNHPTHQTNSEKGTIVGSDALLHLPCLSEESIGWMLEREKDHLPGDDYLIKLKSGALDTSLRRRAFYSMLKACAYYNFGELCLYSAMSYFDRFLSVYELPICSSDMGGRKWDVQLVSVACLSLAAKIEEVYVPSIIDLQGGEPEFLFEGKTIQRMEILVLRMLNWKIKAYTPCNFIDYFFRKMKGEDLALGPCIARSLEIMLCMIEDIDFLDFKPSEIAAAVAVHVLGETQAMDIDKALSSFIQLDKGRVVKCIGLIEELMMSSTITNESGLGSFPDNSPNGVLEVSACLSCCKGDERTFGACPNSCQCGQPESKRRRLHPSLTVEGEEVNSYHVLRS